MDNQAQKINQNIYLLDAMLLAEMKVSVLGVEQLLLVLHEKNLEKIFHRPTDSRTLHM